MIPNVLVIDRARLVNIGGRADVFSCGQVSMVIDLIIVRDEDTFDVIKSRFGHLSQEVPNELLEDYILHYVENPDYALDIDSPESFPYGEEWDDEGDWELPEDENSE